MPTLWRNNVLLGRIVEQAPEPGKPGIHGFLDPTPAFAGIEPMMQMRWPSLPGGPTFLNVLPRTVFDEERPRRGPSEKVAELKPMSSQEARGVPADQLFEIRSDDGTVQGFDFISLMCWVVPEEELAALRQAFGSRDDSRELWIVGAHSASAP